MGTRDPAEPGDNRVDWVDHAKGLCIIMVVMMHSVLGTEAAAGRIGFMNEVVAFAKPFRMPDFFLLSGLFLGRVIGRDWRTYLDRKAVHFAYFYVLWVTIQFAFKAPGFAAQMGWTETGLLYLESFIEPFGTLWFIYLLPVFFIVAKLARTLSPFAVLGAAIALQTANIQTGWTAIDEFAARFVYFYAGYLFAPQIFAFAHWASQHIGSAFAALALWAVINGVMVSYGLSEWPLLSVLLGFAGAGAIITVGTLMAKSGKLDALRFCGAHSIVIYLAFFLPMAATRTLLLKTGVIADVGAMSLIVTAAGVLGALAIWRLALAAHADFLFERPKLFWLAPPKAGAAAVAAAP